VAEKGREPPSEPGTKRMICTTRRKAVEAAGLRPVRCFHFNYLLFVPIWLARQVFRVFDIKGSSESQINTTLLNVLSSRVFDLDVRTAPWLAPPFGVAPAAARGYTCEVFWHGFSSLSRVAVNDTRAPGFKGMFILEHRVSPTIATSVIRSITVTTGKAGCDAFPDGDNLTTEQAISIPS